MSNMLEYLRSRFIHRSASATGNAGGPSSSDSTSAKQRPSRKTREGKDAMKDREPLPPFPPPPPRTSDFLPGSELNPGDRNVWEVARRSLEGVEIYFPSDPADFWKDWPAEAAMSPDVMLVKHIIPKTRELEDLCVKIIPRKSEEMTIIRTLLNFPSEKHLSTIAIPLVLGIINPPELPKCSLYMMEALKPIVMEEMKSVGDCLDFLRQMLEGLAFLHSEGIAHLDVALKNMMIVPSPPSNCTQKHIAQTVHTHYCYIDFGQSVYYGPNYRGPHYDITGSIFNPPEVHNFLITLEGGYDPFPVDIWRLGQEIRIRFAIAKENLAFLKPLALDMVKNDPKQRPTAEEALQRLHQLVEQLEPSYLEKSTLIEQTNYLIPKVGRPSGNNIESRLRRSTWRR